MVYSHQLQATHCSMTASLERLEEDQYRVGPYL
jgi:hypothetical protein